MDLCIFSFSIDDGKFTHGEFMHGFSGETLGQHTDAHGKSFQNLIQRMDGDVLADGGQTAAPKSQSD